MKTYKSLFCVAIFTIISSSGFSQSSVESISEITSEFKKGLLNADDAFVKMQAVYQNGAIHKCATPLYMFVYKHRAEISPSLLYPVQKTKSRSSSNTHISPSGKFEFTYETTGDNAVPAVDVNNNSIPDYVEWAAQAADSSYNHLVHILGYTDPIPNGKIYDISFQELQGTYGFTTPIGGSGPGTRIVLENDFEGFPDNDDLDGSQRGALRATMAHEFKHAIQFAQNNFSGDADAWAEMDATLAEEVVYDAVNDYYNYLGSTDDVFGSPGSTVISGSYEDITWALYFHERYGAYFWPAVWGRIQSSTTDLPLLDAVDQELSSRGYDYTSSLLELYAWHFASGTNSNINFGFDESSFYPNPNAQRTDVQIDDQLSDTLSLGRFSSYFLSVNPPTTASGDVSVLIDSESADINLAVIGIFKNGTVAFEYTEPEAGFFVVNEGWKWADMERVGAIVLNENRTSSQTFKIRISDTFPTSIPTDDTKPTITELMQNYPNPFNPSTIIPLSLSESEKVKIDIYDITGRLVQSVFDGNLSSGNYKFSVNLENVASGVYLYRLQTNNQIHIKRMMLVK